MYMTPCQWDQERGPGLSWTTCQSICQTVADLKMQTDISCSRDILDLGQYLAGVRFLI